MLYLFPLLPLMRAPCHHAALTCRTAGLLHACGSGASATAQPCCPPSPCSERCHCDWALPQSQSKHHPRCHWPPVRVQLRPAHPYPQPHWGGTGPREDTKERRTNERRTDVQSRRAKVLSLRFVKPEFQSQVSSRKEEEAAAVSQRGSNWGNCNIDGRLITLLIVNNLLRQLVNSFHWDRARWV